jgi:hypothetical protein
MKRKILIALLALGTVGGYGSAFACARHHARERHERFERHVADLCVDAATHAKARDAATSQ